ncbi:MAG: sugar ABC transporter ATP-binding protein [Sphaerochaeta sp.]
MNHITKSFPGVMALDDVQFRLKAGQVMALLGENGAGKSTLVKILSGVYTRDEGEIILYGEQIETNLKPRQAQELGIAIIHQELNMCAHLNIAENMFLGHERLKRRLLDNKTMHKRAKEVLDSLEIDLDTHTLVGDLAVSKQQMVEIARALQANAKILIMDEPTSALTNVEIEQLFTLIRALKAKGVGIIYISHRLEELQHIVDTVTIMRDGRFIIEKPFAELTMNQIISYMVGREIKEKFPRIDTDRKAKRFSVSNLHAGPMVRNISFDLYEGEILGIAGLMGAGRTETSRAIFGADPKTGGTITLNGKEVSINHPNDAIVHGIVLAPEDRKKDGLCTKLSIRENIALPNLDMITSRFGIINRKKEAKLVANVVKDLHVKLASIESDAAALSGGNQQKVVVGKWLARESKVVIFDEPTRGIDVAAKVEIYHLMNELKAKGIAVLFISSEMPEILGIADRILVMCDGRVTGELMREEATQERIMELATQFENKFEIGTL